MTEDKKNKQESPKTQQEKPEKKVLTRDKEQTVTKSAKDNKAVLKSQPEEMKASANKKNSEKISEKTTAKAQDPKALTDKREGKQTEKPVDTKLIENTKANTSTENKAESQTPSTEKSKSEKKGQTKDTVKLEGLFAFKMSMTTFYNEKGERVPVTALKYEPCYISQIKNREKESYEAVQVAFKAQKNKRCSKALIGHLKPAGFKEGARFMKEIRQSLPEGVKPGQEISIESLKKGDLVKVSSLSKGRGFSGVMKKWNFAGGKASHGSKSHRRTGSIGQHTEPSRVMPGRKMPGQYGFKRVSRLKVPIVDVLPEEGMIFVKGPVPGARNTLVSLKKMSHTT